MILMGRVSSQKEQVRSGVEEVGLVWPVGEGECGREGSSQLGAIADDEGGQEGGGEGEKGRSKVAVGEEQPEQAFTVDWQEKEGSANAHLHPLGPG